MSIQAIVVIAAGLINYALCCIWYTTIGKKRVNAWKFEEDKVNPRNPIPYLVAFIGSLWTSYGHFILIKHIAPKNMVELLSIVIGIWLLIIVGTAAKHASFAGKGLRATVLDYTIDLIGGCIMGVMIWKWSGL